VPPQPLRARVGAGEIQFVDALVEDISRGGVMLAIQDTSLDAIERPCVVHFSGSMERVNPSTSRGWIRRTVQEHGHLHLAVEFAEPLVALELEMGASRGALHPLR
jgi:hypothetical protein